MHHLSVARKEANRKTIQPDHQFARNQRDPHLGCGKRRIKVRVVVRRRATRFFVLLPCLIWVMPSFMPFIMLTFVRAFFMPFNLVRDRRCKGACNRTIRLNRGSGFSACSQQERNQEQEQRDAKEQSIKSNWHTRSSDLAFGPEIERQTSMPPARRSTDQALFFFVQRRSTTVKVRQSKVTEYSVIQQ
jgi:hypothetical protein